MDTIHYKFYGKRDKPLILFLHGFLGSLHDWQNLCASLGNDYSCLLADLPWHGESAGVNNMPEAAQAIITLLDELDLKKVFLYGYSLGGRLSLYLMLKYPHYFQRAILESASPGLKTEQQRSERIIHDEKLARRLESESMESFLSFWYAQPLFENLVSLNGFEKIYKRRLENSPQRMANALRTLGTGRQPSLWEEIKNNKIPVRLLVGEYDEKFINIAGEMSELNDKFTRMIINNSGHTVYIENSTAVIKNIKVFLNEELSLKN